MSFSARIKTYARSLLVALMTAVLCTSLSGCLLAAAGAGAAGGYMIGREAEEEQHEEHHHRDID
jgi:hypothetical protein